MGVLPVTRSVTGFKTGSRTGTASATGGTTVSITAEVAPSASCEIGTVIVETVPPGTTRLTTGTDAITSSAKFETGLTTGCSKPDGCAGAGIRGSGLSTLSVTEEMELVTPPSKDEVSERVSADAAVEENVSHVRVAAPANRTGRRARHGERDLAMRITPRCNSETLEE